MVAETVIDAHDTGTTAQSATVATLTAVGNRDLDHLQSLNVRLEVTQGMVGTSPTCNVYLQRATQPSPGSDDWQDFYHFPEITTSVYDKEAVFPLPHAQDADGLLATYSDNVEQETIAADTVRAGHWGEQIRIREVVGGTGLSQAAIYSVHMVGR